MTEPVVTSHVPVSQEDPRTVAVIALDDGKANALSRDMIAEIRRNISAVVAGREGRFSGGFDLGVMRGGDMSAVINLVADGGDLVRHMYGASVPVVAACTGHAVAAGALMLLGSDVRVGAEGAFKIGLNEVAIGMTLPSWAYTIAADRISNRHLQRSLANARQEAKALAGLDTKAYAKIMGELRGETLATMDDQIAADRAHA